jgi:hypothetical protein
VRRGIWTFILFLLTAVVCVSAVPQPDLPETSYNEADTPVNQSPPAVLGVRVARPPVHLVVLPRKTVQAEWKFRLPVNEDLKAPSSIHFEARSFQDLLCTFLI